MTLYHVRYFVRHDACQLTFSVRRLDGSDVDVHGATRKSESIDFFLIYDMKGIRPLLSRSVGRKFLSQTLHIAGDWIRVGQ